MKTFKQFKEDAPVVTTVNNPTTQEPVVSKKKQKKYTDKAEQQKLSEEATFAGNKVYSVDSDVFNKLNMCKSPWQKYASIIEDPEVCADISRHSRLNSGKSILVQDITTGSYKMLKKGKHSNI
jgi:hypothetical protein